MFTFILDVVTFSALLLFAVNLESSPPSATFFHGRADGAGIVSRYLLVALVAFPWVLFDRLKAGERALRRVGTKLIFYASMFSGRPYLSEILISVFISIAFMGSFVVQRWTRRLARQTVKLTVPIVGIESSN